MQRIKGFFIHRYASALLVGALCVLVAAASADAKSYKPSGSSNSGSSSSVSKSYKPGGSSGSFGRGSTVQTTRSESPKYVPSRLPVGSRTSTAVRPAPSYHSTTIYNPSAASRPSRAVDRAPAATYRPPTARPSGTVDRAPGTTYRAPGTYRPSGTTDHTPDTVRRAPAATYRPEQPRERPGTTQVSPAHGYGPGGPTRYTPTPRYIPAPKSYKPAVYRGGFYYYPSHRHTRPYHYGHWVWDYYPGWSYRSCYYYFGLFPYIEIVRVVHTPYTYVRYVGTPIYIGGTYYRDDHRYTELDAALSDIRSAWISGRFDLIEEHVPRSGDIAILLDGRYDYSISTEDYLYMTRDAMAELETISFTWDKVRERSDGRVTGAAQHRFRENGYTKTVYVGYTLERIGGRYYITEVDSSSSPLL